MTGVVCDRWGGRAHGGDGGRLCLAVVQLEAPPLGYRGPRWLLQVILEGGGCGRPPLDWAEVPVMPHWAEERRSAALEIGWRG